MSHNIYSRATTPDKVQRIAVALNDVLGLPQEAIAARAGLSFTSVNAWIHKRRRPHRTNLEKLQELLGELTANPAPENRVRAALAVLHARYGAPRLGNREEPLDELIYILLSLKTSFRTYEDTFDSFRKRFKPWGRLLAVAPDEIEAHIRRGGLGSLKARAFVDIARRLKDDFGAVSLDRLKDWSDEDAQRYLMSLPGVGLKTARCVLMYSFNRDVVPVDTHTYRVGVRLGMVPTSRNPNDAHGAFDKATPSGLAYALHTNFVAHGRELCIDPVPKCGECPARHLCDYAVSRATESQASVGFHGTPMDSTVPLSQERPIAVDLYCGSGGLSRGLELGGWHVGYAMDWDKHAAETHRQNFPSSVTQCADVRTITGGDIQRAVGGAVALVAGGPNCQGVSERGLRTPDDPRNFMFPEFLRIVDELRPTAFLMENVPGLAHRHNYQLLRRIFSEFEKLGYNCAADVLLAADYGVPQLRYRFVMIGTIAPVKLTFPAKRHSDGSQGPLLLPPYVTVDEALSDLPGVSDGREALAYRTPPTNAYQRTMRGNNTGVWNHVCSDTEEINLLRASHVPEGGNWKDIPPDLLPDRFFACRMTDHSTTYARLRRDAPAFTITSLFGNITAGAFTHPVENRALSVREGARLQSFPDDFRFYGPRHSQYRQIGNAVPPLLAAAIGRHLLALLRGDNIVGQEPRITRDLLADPTGWDALPVLTPRFKRLFGQATRWPKGWGAEPTTMSDMLTENYMLRPEYWPAHLRDTRRKSA
ncbi:MAG TPA: DNA (cytosine-5-)-methyltransferase [Thermoanaerobaculia bacterium]|jgi:DNA-cytosine methyltransferase